MKTSEFQKILYNGKLGTVLFLFLVLHIIVCCFLYQDNHDGKISFSPEGYRKLQQEVKKMDNETAYAYVEEKMSQLQSDNETLCYEPTFFQEYFLLSTVLDEINYSKEYEEQCDDIIEKANTFQETSILGGRSEYVARNAQQIKKDYEKIKANAPMHGPARGITLFVQNVVTDFFVIALLLIVVVQLVCRERESRELLLYKTTFYGKLHLGVKKIGVLFFFSLFLVFLFYGTSLLIAGKMYGIGDFTREIQSIPYYSESVLFLSIGTLILFFFLIKWMALFLLALLFYSLAVVCKRSGMFYITVVLLFGIGVVFDTVISDNSQFQIAKYLNFYSILRSERFFKYINLNVMGVPLHVMDVVLLFMGIVLFLLLYLSITVFYTQREGQHRKKQYHFGEWKFAEKTNHLLIQEFYKMMINGHMLLFLFVCTLLFLVFQKPVRDEFYIANDAYYNAYIKILNGPVNAEKISYLEKEQSRYDGIEEDYREGNISEKSYNEKMKSYESFEKIVNEKTPYLLSSGGYFIEEDAFLLLTGGKEAKKKDIELAFIVVIMVFLPFSYLNGMEYQLGTNIYLKVYSCGGKYTARRKLVLGVFLLSFVYLLVYGLFFYRVFYCYGTAGLDAPACSLDYLCRIPVSVNMWQYLLLVSVMRYTGLVFLLLLLYAVSRWTKSFVGNLITGTIVVILPLLLEYLEIPGMKYVLFNPLLLGNIFGVNCI